MSSIPPLSAVDAFGFAGGVLAGVYQLIQISKVPKSQRIDQDALFYVINFIALPLIGAFFAYLARTKCAEIDPWTATIAGYAGLSLLQKLQNDNWVL
jgi:hypothetical protein